MEEGDGNKESESDKSHGESDRHLSKGQVEYSGVNPCSVLFAVSSIGFIKDIDVVSSQER